MYAFPSYTFQKERRIGLAGLFPEMVKQMINQCEWYGRTCGYANQCMAWYHMHCTLLGVGCH